MKLLNKTAFITGASTGIGLSIAKAFVSEGCNVAISFPTFDPPQPEDIEYFSTYSDQIFWVPCDVTNERSVSQAVNKTIGHFGKLNILVNNAGISIKSPLIDSSITDFDKIISVNLRGSYLVGKHGISAILQSDGIGTVINITSELSYLGRENYSAYCASKAAIHGLTRSWAREFAPNIRVNSIAPGPIATRMCDPETMNKHEFKLETSNPMKRFGNTEEIATTAVFLASDDTSFYTGQCLSPNGGAVFY
ncbi:SDR family NAD(P)-dependent oxidoreductase [Pelagibaculum spongiae]|nr:SDR family oxidoreductase [Pelagibaculum spongiae]